MKTGVKGLVRFYPTLKLARPVGPRRGGEAGSPVVRLDHEGVRSLESAYPHVSPVPMRERLEAGDACYALPGRTGEIEAFVWTVSGRSFYVPEVGSDIWVPEDVSYFYEAFTFPTSRGRGLMAALLNGTVNALADVVPAHHRCEAWVARRNRPSSRAFEKAGFLAYESFFFASVGRVRVSVGRPWLREGEL